MDADADFSLERSKAGQTALLTGDWTATRIRDAGLRLAQAMSESDDAVKGTEHLTAARAMLAEVASERTAS